MIQPNMLEAVTFINKLTGADNTLMRWRCIHEKDRNVRATEFTGTVEAMWPHFIRLQSQGFAIYYFLNETHELTGPHARDENVIKVRALPADFDHGLPAPWEWHKEPDMIVHTSVSPEGVQKGQALWLVDDCALDRFKPICQQIIAQYNSDPAVCNLSRILRLPGSLHLKGEPQLVTWHKP